MCPPVPPSRERTSRIAAHARRSKNRIRRRVSHLLGLQPANRSAARASCFVNPGRRYARRLSPGTGSLECRPGGMCSSFPRQALVNELAPCARRARTGWKRPTGGGDAEAAACRAVAVRASGARSRSYGKRAVVCGRAHACQRFRARVTDADAQTPCRRGTARVVLLSVA